jgi:hypothetical protein
MKSTYGEHMNRFVSYQLQMHTTVIKGGVVGIASGMAYLKS